MSNTPCTDPRCAAIREEFQEARNEWARACSRADSKHRRACRSDAGHWCAWRLAFDALRQAVKTGRAMLVELSRPWP